MGSLLSIMTCSKFKFIIWGRRYFNSIFIINDFNIPLLFFNLLSFAEGWRINVSFAVYGGVFNCSV